GYARHVDEVGAGDRHAAPAAQQVTRGAHRGDRNRCRRRSRVLATGGCYGQAAADDREESTRCHTFLLLTDASAQRGANKETGRVGLHSAGSRFAPLKAWASRTTSRLGVHG